MNRRYVLNLSISPAEWQKIYAGHAQSVFCRSQDGVSIKMPAKHLRKFVTRQGILGTFELELGENNQFVSITQRN